MYLRKIIKIYFLSVMCLVSVAGLTYNDHVHKMYISVMHSIDQNALMVGNHVSEIFKTSDIIEKIANLNGNKTLNLRVFEKNRDFVSFDLRNVSGAFVESGDEARSVFEMELSGNDGGVVLHGVNFSVNGIDPEKIVSFSLQTGDGISFAADRKANVFSFNNLEYSIPGGENEIFSVLVAVNSEAGHGDRFGVEIASPDDLDLSFGGEDFVLSEYYPVKSGYVSVVNARLPEPEEAEEGEGEQEE